MIWVRIAERVGVLGVAASLLLLVATAPAAAAPKRISGELNRPGFTVIALADGGEATMVDAGLGAFRLSPPAREVSLHLRAFDGTYAGPIVVGRDGERAIVGVRRGARLGEVEVRSGKGFAKLDAPLPEKWLVAERTARARRGVPIGAGNFGRVRSKAPRNPVPSDPDLDGVPNPLDIDDDGDLVLDNLDRSIAARSSQVVNQFGVHSTLGSFQGVVNANAPGSTDAQIAAGERENGGLGIEILPGDSAELDCGGSANPAPPPPLVGGLAYCSWGGSGTRPPAPTPGVPPGPNLPFPDCCDPDGDGFGTLTPAPEPPPNQLIGHGASTRDPVLDPSIPQIGTGDVLIQHVSTGVPESQCPDPSNPGCASFTATVQYVFATQPALASYIDAAGNSQPIQHPIRDGDPGSNTNGLPVGAPPGEDVLLALTLWRPQRRAIEEELCPPPVGRPCEPSDWVDIGGLSYTVGFTIPAGFGNCPVSIPPGQELTPLPTVPSGGGVIDLAPDRPANPGNTFTLWLNLSQCLSSAGVSFESGDEVNISFTGSSPDGTGRASHGVVFKRQ